jgi:hypothetical protein
MVYIMQALKDEGFGIHRSSPRIRKIGGGCRGHLPTVHDQLLFILTYYRHYPTQEFTGIIFGLSQPQVCDRIKYLSILLKKIMNRELSLPKRPPDRGELFVSNVPGLDYIIDGCERPRTRPRDCRDQTEHYSGKKKQHCIKNTIVIDARTKKIIALGKTRQGRWHDKRIIDMDRMIFPAGSRINQDTGFLGHKPEGVHIRMPKKRSKYRPLSDYDKFDNRTISMDRVAVEHAIRGMKIYRIAKDTFRNRREGFSDLIVEIASALYNYKIAA